MFVLKFAVDATDRVSKKVDSIDKRIKRFSRSMKQVFNFIGLAMVFDKIKDRIDKAFSVSAYADEWDNFKTNMQSGWDGVLKHIADGWGPMIGSVDTWGKKFIGYIHSAIRGIQVFGALLTNALTGHGSAESLKFARETATYLQYGTGPADESAEDRKKREEKERSEKIDDLEKQQKELKEKPTYDVEARGRVVENAPENTMAQRAAYRMAQAQNARIPYKPGMENDPLNKMGMGAVEPLEDRQRLRRPFELQNIISRQGTSTSFKSGFKRGHRNPEDKEELKFQKRLREAQRRVAHGARISSKMQAVLDKDQARKDEKKAQADEQARQKAIIDTAANTKRAADELEGALKAARAVTVTSAK